ncbi:YfhO family protein [Dellaglioa sp. L3N]
MTFQFGIKKSKMVYLYYIAFFLVLTALIFGTYAFFGYSLIQSHDPAEQHLPILENYRNLLGTYLQHPFQPLTMWSWKLGLGADQFQIFAYYIIGDIFSYVSLLFPSSSVITVYQFTLILRLFCVGASFIFFARHFNLTNSSILGGTFIYTFTSFTLYSSLMQPFFLTPFIIFPLLIIGIEKILQSQKPHFFILILSWTFINNFYFSIILVVGALIYLILRYLLYYRKNLSFLRITRTFIVTALISLLLSAFMLVPSTIAILGSTRSGGVFANGLTLFPAYYYINLPAQLLASGESTFWTKLGLSSFAVIAIFHIFYHHKKYPLISISLIIGLIMLLFPMFGAIFNGFQSTSNRWILTLFLPIALTSAFLIDSLATIKLAEIKFLTKMLVGYLLLLIIPFFINGNSDVFISIIFLTLFFIVILLYKNKDNANRVIFGLILINIACTGIMFASPFTGFFSQTLIPAGSYNKLLTGAFSDLDKSIPTSNSFRASTSSTNYDLGANFKLRNNLNSHLNIINSYYSIQNGDIGKFSNILGNVQYNNNVPIENFDDRTVANNFLGVKYLFSKKNNDTIAKIPYGYTLSKSAITDTGKITQTDRYSTKNNFPLIYWQSTVISDKNYQKLSPSDKERNLSKAVSVNDSTGLTKASLESSTEDVPFIIEKKSNIGQSNEKTSVIKNNKFITNPDLDQFKIKFKYPEKYKNSELHISLSGIKQKSLSSKKQIQLSVLNNASNQSNELLDINRSLSEKKAFRKQLRSGTSGTGYSISIQSAKTTNKINQLSVENSSFYKVLSDTTFNMGYLKKFPSSLNLLLSKPGTYSFKINVTAVPLGKTYVKEVRKLQSHKLNDLKFTTNQVSGNMTTSKVGILTSSIPYSKGWKATDNGHSIPVLKTNIAFVGLKLKSGSHQIVYHYETPGLYVGIILSILGVLIWFIYILVPIIWRYFKNR